MKRFGQAKTTGTFGDLGDTTRGNLIPEGWHGFVIKHVKDASGDPDKPRYSVVVACIDPGEPWHRAGFWEDFHLSAKALGRFAKLCKVTGVINGDPDAGEWSAEPDDLVGKPVRLLVKSDTYQGKSRIRVDFLGMEPWEPEPDGDYAVELRKAQAEIAASSKKGHGGNAGNGESQRGAESAAADAPASGAGGNGLPF